MKPLILPYKGKYPQIHPSARIAPNATITGDVIIGPECSIWFNAVIRGDVNQIRLGARVNVQDGVIIHSTRGKQDTVIGDDTSIGHGAILHGCVTKGRSLIGMAAIVLDDAVIEEQVIVGANAMVPQGMVCESGYIYAGTPARQLKAMDKERIDFYIEETSKAYIKYSNNYPEFTIKSDEHLA